jgi:hypothetical protein
VRDLTGGGGHVVQGKAVRTALICAPDLVAG